MFECREDIDQDENDLKEREKVVEKITEDTDKYLTTVYGKEYQYSFLKEIVESFIMQMEFLTGSPNKAIHVKFYEILK